MSSIASGGSSQQAAAAASLQMEKKKTKVLRQALKEERETRSQTDEQLKQAQAKIEELTQQIADKEQRYLQIYQEKASLEETLIKESKSKQKLQQQVQSSSKQLPPQVANPYGQSMGEESKQSQQSASSSDISGKPLPDDKIEQLEMKVNKQTGQLIVAEGKVQEYEKQIGTLNEQIQRMEQSYQKFVQEENDNKDKMQKEINSLKHEIEFNKKEHKEAIETVKVEEKINMDQLREEIQEVQSSRDKLFEEKFKVEEEVDAKLKKIKDLERDMQLAADEVTCRKQIIEQMTENMMRHETESQEMAQKLTLMKNQIMEFNMGQGMNKKYAAVKIGTIRHTPVSLEFIEPEEQKYFLVVDSRSQEVTINVENIDSFRQIDESNRIQVIYYIQANSESGLIKKQETFEVYETDLVLKSFEGCRHKIQGTGSLPEFQAHKFQKPLMSQTPKARKNSVIKTD